MARVVIAALRSGAGRRGVRIGGADDERQDIWGRRTLGVRQNPDAAIP
jgi:hypothetical protein